MRHHSVPVGSTFGALPTEVHLIEALQLTWLKALAGTASSETWQGIRGPFWSPIRSVDLPKGLAMALGAWGKWHHLQCWLIFLWGHWCCGGGRVMGSLQGLLWMGGSLSSLHTREKGPRERRSWLIGSVDSLRHEVHKLAHRSAHQDHLQLLESLSLQACCRPLHLIHLPKLPEYCKEDELKTKGLRCCVGRALK